MSEETRMMIFSGSANPQLAEAVAKELNVPMGEIRLSQFSDGEHYVEVLESVRGRDVFVIQPTCKPSNDHLMQLLIIADALYRTSAGRITAVMPYYGYARQDRRVQSQRVPISAKLVADMLSTGRFDRVLTIDLHSEQVQGFFDVPVDNIYAQSVLLDDIMQQNYKDVTVVSPDIGGVVRARAVAKDIDAGLAIIDKRRPKPNQAKVMNLIGDVRGKTCILVDDLVDTAGTLCGAAEALKAHGADSVIAYATHPVFSGAAIENIIASELDQVVVTDTVPLSEAGKACRKIRQLSVAGLLAATIWRISNEQSVSDMFLKN